MRLWTLHPKHLDARGLVALWREGLLALAVLRGKTRGYRNHPQLERFRKTRVPVAAVAAYLDAVLAEGRRRGYRFDGRKLRGIPRLRGRLPETRGQLAFEREHLLRKLWKRDRTRWRTLKMVRRPDAHPLFRIVPGKVRGWEKTRH